MCCGFSFPLSFCSVCVPGYGAFLFPPPFFPCRVISGGPLSIISLRQFVILLTGVMLSLYFSFDSFWGTLTVFCLVPRLSFVSSRLSGLLLLCRFSSGFSQSFGCTSTGFSSISSLLISPFWLATGLPSWVFSFRVAFLHHFLLPSLVPSLSLLAFPLFLRCYSSLNCPLLRLWCRFYLSP